MCGYLDPLLLPYVDVMLVEDLVGHFVYFNNSTGLVRAGEALNRKV